jgi:adenine phosphoribosyltransferase
VDIFPIFKSPAAFEVLITNLLNYIASHTIPRLDGGKIDVVVSLDARGFLLGPIIASRLEAAFVPVRKSGKLPGKCVTAEYVKEYGKVKVFSPSLIASNPYRIFVCRMYLRCKRVLFNPVRTS